MSALGKRGCNAGTVSGIIGAGAANGDLRYAKCFVLCNVEIGGNMIFKYDASRLKEYRQNGIFRALLLIGISIFLMLPIMYLTMNNIELDKFIIMITMVLFIFMAAAASTVGIIIGYKRAKTEFESYQIECDDEKIVITSNMAHKEIKTDKIKKIFKDKKTIFTLH